MINIFQLMLTSIAAIIVTTVTSRLVITTFVPAAALPYNTSPEAATVILILGLLLMWAVVSATVSGASLRRMEDRFAATHNTVRDLRASLTKAEARAAEQVRALESASATQTHTLSELSAARWQIEMQTAMIDTQRAHNTAADARIPSLVEEARRANAVIADLTAALQERVAEGESAPARISELECSVAALTHERDAWILTADSRAEEVADLRETTNGQRMAIEVLHTQNNEQAMAVERITAERDYAEAQRWKNAEQLQSVQTELLHAVTGRIASEATDPLPTNARFVSLWELVAQDTHSTAGKAGWWSRYEHTASALRDIAHRFRGTASGTMEEIEILRDTAQHLSAVNDGEQLMMIVCEAAEAMEAHRADDPPDSKLPGFTSKTVELADIVIRVMSYGVQIGVPVGQAIIAKAEYNKTRPHRHGGKLC